MTRRSTPASTLEAQRSVLSAKIALLQAGLEELRPELISGIIAGHFIQDASLPATPFSPDHRVPKQIAKLMAEGRLTWSGQKFVPPEKCRA